ncbi:MAG TPA: phosphoribosyltransferase [Steroidobacteraceae bacterium]|nr:phosphoribosyltransferase [Steroidobacteraceae bacterium]
MIIPAEEEWPASSRNVISFSAVSFASCFAYSPSGSGLVCEQGRLLCARLKTLDPAWLSRLAAGVWLEAHARKRFAAVLGRCVVLVPVPGSGLRTGADWVGERLACCLKELDLGGQVWPVLRRCRAVRKSAFAPAGARPSVLEHYESFAVEPTLDGGSARKVRGAGLQLTLVDDVITRGRTVLGAAARLREAFPGAQVCAFALLRTLARGEPLCRVLDPCEGEVRWICADARRLP